MILIPYGSEINAGKIFILKIFINCDSIYKYNMLHFLERFSLSVGYVDSMGRFVTEIEPDPCRKSDRESRLSRAVKRLVHIEQDKVSYKQY